MILSMFLKLIVNYVIPIFIITMLLIFIQMLYLYSIIRNYKKYEDKNYLEKTEKNIKKFHSLQKIENYLMYVCNWFKSRIIYVFYKFNNNSNVNIF